MRFSIEGLREQLRTRRLDTDSPTNQVVSIDEVQINPANKNQVQVVATVMGKGNNYSKREVTVPIKEVNKGKIPDSAVCTIFRRLLH